MISIKMIKEVCKALGSGSARVVAIVITGTIIITIEIAKMMCNFPKSAFHLVAFAIVIIAMILVFALCVLLKLLLREQEEVTVPDETVLPDRIIAKPKKAKKRDKTNMEKSS